MRSLLRAGGLLLLSVCVGSIALSGILDGLNPRIPGDEPTFVGVLWLSSFVGFPIVGAAITWKIPRNAIGWMLGGIGASIGLVALSGEYATYALLTREGTVPAGDPVAWISSWLGNVPVILILLLLIVFPRGTTRNRFWRVTARAVVAGGAALAAMYAVRPGPLDAAAQIDNPFGVPGTRWFLDPAIATMANFLVLVLLAAIVDKILMYRRARGDERQQIRWFALAAVSFPILFAVSIVLEGLFGRNRWGELDPVVVAFVLGFNGMAAAIGIAVFRYRLYDVGALVNRTLVYGLLTAVLAGTYAGFVFGSQELLAPVAADSDLAIAASTLAVAALFRPVRRRLQGFIDRRFYRKKFDTERTMEEFSAHLRDEVELASLSHRLVSVVTETMQPAHVSLWVREGRQ